ncbi:MAG: PEP-CTERM system histidine kinase PrsK, partial [Gammaproteobacteria bacterium]|nr:PEP-CTERM system histidine kinase PrsK [Gammaproteobacteria bacterium]
DVDDWISRGFIIAIAICIATIGINRLPMASIRLTLSRPVVFYTAGLVIAGIYLLVVAVGGYYLKVFGGDWGVIARNTFVFAALLFLFALIVSGEMRGRLRVYIDKHFLNYKYDYREEWLRLIRQLSSEQELGRLEEQSVKVLADIMDSPSGILWVKKNSESFYPVAQLGFSELQGLTVSTSSPMARFLEQWQWVINTDEYQKEPELYQGLTLPDWVENSNNIQLIIPLMLQVRLYGFVVLSRPRAEKEFNWEDIDLLRTAGRQVAIHLSQARSNLALVEARQFEAFNRLSAYVMHDLKNLMTQLGLVVKNAEKHKSNPAFVDDAISTVENAVGRMNRLLAQLKSGIMTVEKVATITIDEVLAQVIKDKSRQLPIPEIVRSVDGVINADKDRLVSVVGHIVQNAQDATGPNGTIKIYASMDQESIIVEIVDNGVGMDNEFVTTRLFKPFDSTKGLTGMGIGAHEVRQFIEELGGSVKVDSHPGVGTTFSLVIPRRQLVLS